MKKKTTRKRYATEFLVRSEDGKLMAKLKKIAQKKRMSVNSLVLIAIDNIKENV